MIEEQGGEVNNAFGTGNGERPMWRRLIMLTFLLAAMTTTATAASKDDVAVIIGNRTYKGGVPAVDYAHNDAEAMLRLVRDGLGYRPENIIDLRDAGLLDLTKVFGSAASVEGSQLWRYVKPGKSEVTIYYSGHGVPGINDGKGYLLPVDADPNAPQLTGYPLDQLYANLAKLPAKSITVYLDACFSGESAKGMLITAASPFGIKVNPPKQTAATLTVVTAASSTQLASWDDKAQHGLFTEYLLRAVYGEAASGGTITAQTLKRYLDEEMTYAARRQRGREQVADMQASGSPVLVSWPGGKTPGRPVVGVIQQAATTTRPLPPPSGMILLKGRFPDPGSEFKDCPDCPEMVVIPAGSFMMGSEDGLEKEKPVHPVTISRSFAVGKYAVTQGEWEAVMESNPSKFKGARNPVEMMSWSDALEFIRRLNAKVGLVAQVSMGGNGPYRLLAEAEWEYAARAGTSTKYWWGDDIGRGNANCDGCGSQWDREQTAPVGSFRPNPFGLYDMNGNVWQLVQDCFTSNYAGAPADGSAASGRNSCRRVARGGPWNRFPKFLSSTYREHYQLLTSGIETVGFRLARTLP